MHELIQRCRMMDDATLESSVKNLCAVERRTTVELLAHLAVLDERELAQRRAMPSLFVYCLQTLRFTEDQAASRIAAARLAARYPECLDMLAGGQLSVKALVRLSPHLNNDNHVLVLEGACGKDREELDRYIASIAPRPDIRDHIQMLPVAARESRILELLRTAGAEQPKPGEPAPSAAACEGQPTPQAPTRPEKRPRDSVETLSPGRVHFGFTGDEELREKIKRAKQLLWHKHPEGHLADIIGAALDALLERKDPDRKKPPRQPVAVSEAAISAPESAAREPATRYIPRWVRADVWKRDGGRCAYTTSDGVRCAEEAGLEYDHVVPFGLGGPSDDPANIRLLCRAHNQLLARDTFGAKADHRSLGSADGGATPSG